MSKNKPIQQKRAPDWVPRFGLAAAAVVVAATTAVVTAAAAVQAVVATAAEQDQQDDDPAHIATTEAIVTHKNTSIGKFQRLSRSFHVILPRQKCAGDSDLTAQKKYRIIPSPNYYRS